MTRAYKANRARGTRQSTYKKKVYEFGGFKVSAKRNLTAKEYKEKFYEENKTVIEKRYQRMYNIAKNMKDPTALEAFKQQYINAEDWFKKTSKEVKTVKALKLKVEKFYGEEAQRFRWNAWTKVEKTENYSTIQELFEEENESFDINKLEFKGDSVYVYITNKGTFITITFDPQKDSEYVQNCDITISK